MSQSRNRYPDTQKFRCNCFSINLSCNSTGENLTQLNLIIKLISATPMQSRCRRNYWDAIVLKCHYEETSEIACARWVDGDEKSRRRSFRITYPRARGLFKCKHNVVPGRIVPLSVILQFNLRSRGSADAARPGKLAHSLARSFVHCNIVKSPSFHHDYLLSSFRHYLSPSIFGILPRVLFFRLDFSILRWRTRYQFSLSPSR